MTDRIIDSCSLLNLYTGWGSLHELQRLGHTWYIADSAIKEAQYTREIGADGKVVSAPLELAPLILTGVLNRVKAEHPDELALYVNLSSDLDDGEAEALAIAKVRGLILLTDDAKALRVAQRPDLAVETITTVGVLQSWIAKAGIPTERAQQVIARIEKLARFRPFDAAELQWWRSIA